MKHVLVLFNAGKSSTLLQERGLTPPQANTTVFDSTRRADYREMRNPVAHHSMRKNGVQYFHFPFKEPQQHFPAANHDDLLIHADYWVKRLTQQLQERQQQLDAVIIPLPGPGMAYTRYENLLNHIHAAFPHVRLLLTQPATELGYMPQNSPLFAQAHTLEPGESVGAELRKLVELPPLRGPEITAARAR